MPTKLRFSCSDFRAQVTLMNIVINSPLISKDTFARR